jgi:hypothetical protein
MFQGGGNIALIVPVIDRLVRRGHRVRVLGGPGIWSSRMKVSAAFRERISAVGATFVALPEPQPHPLDESPLPRGLLHGWSPARLARSTMYVNCYRWAPAWSSAVGAELSVAPADVLVADHLLLGALVGGEAAGLPTAALVHGGYKHRPAPGIPPYGTGWLPRSGPLTTAREALWMSAMQRVFQRDGLPALNRARCLAGLAPLGTPFEQYDRATRVLLLSCAAFEFPAESLPDNVRYVGTPFDDIGACWQSPWPPDDTRRLVVVSLSTLSQGQEPLLQRVVSALAALPVRALVTLGPAIESGRFAAPANVVFERFVPHTAVLAHTDVLVTQCGFGGVTKALAHGVPMLCLPLVGDQPDNAARVVARGAGVRLEAAASVEQIREAVMLLLADPRFTAAARRLGAALDGDHSAERAALELESLVSAVPSQLRA